MNQGNLKGNKPARRVKAAAFNFIFRWLIGMSDMTIFDRG